MLERGKQSLLLSNKAICKKTIEVKKKAVVYLKGNNQRMMSTASLLATGEMGCRFCLPSGTTVKLGANDSGERLDLVDKGSDISWSIRFFENLHMDLRESSRNHLEEGIRK